VFVTLATPSDRNKHLGGISYAPVVRERWWSPADDGITISLRVTPGTRRSEVVEVSPERMRVRVRAPAVEGKANAELRRFLSELFHVRRSAVTVLRGEHSREKVVRIAGLEAPPSALTARSRGLSPPTAPA
jgi:uncharacterized protein